jgi:hypothetical protein
MLLPMVKDKVLSTSMYSSLISLPQALSPSPVPGIHEGRVTAQTAGKEVEKS